MQKEKEDIMREKRMYADLLEIGYSHEEALKIIKGKTKRKTPLNQTIFNMLIEIGIPTNVDGFRYASEAIKLLMENENMPITKELYPTVAKSFNTTPIRVERCIIHGIEVAFCRGDVEVLESYFKNSYSFKKKKPTNAEFLTTVAYTVKLKLEE